MNHNPAHQNYAVIGDPIEHSLSPVLHGAALKACDSNATFSKVRVSPQELPLFCQQARDGAYSGFSVTVPHKCAIIPLLDELTEEARIIGAVNAVVVKESKLIGHNTDGRGYLKSLLEEFSLDFSRMNAVLIGAGGAALAIGHALCGTSPASLTLVNRTRENADILAAKLQITHPEAHLPTGSFGDLNRLCEDADFVVNATVLGMSGKNWPDLSFLNALPETAIVSDIVYAPIETPLLTAAAARGLKIHHGDGMLLHQGAIAFELFTGKKAPLEAMRKALAEAL